MRRRWRRSHRSIALAKRASQRRSSTTCGRRRSSSVTMRACSPTGSPTTVSIVYGRTIGCPLSANWRHPSGSRHLDSTRPSGGPTSTVSSPPWTTSAAPSSSPEGALATRALPTEPRGHVIQDLAALNKMELLLWDVWGLMQAEPDASLALVDEIAERTQAADGFADVQRLYARSGLAVPERIRSLSPVVGPHEVALGAEL